MRSDLHNLVGIMFDAKFELQVITLGLVSKISIKPTKYLPWPIGWKFQNP